MRKRGEKKWLKKDRKVENQKKKGIDQLILINNLINISSKVNSILLLPPKISQEIKMVNRNKKNIMTLLNSNDLLKY